jgi:hypothetical protein
LFAPAPISPDFIVSLFLTPVGFFGA